MKLTPSQEEALIYNKNILVEAGAGSGKTTLFVERYLKILIENPSISPQNIIALINKPTGICPESCSEINH